MREKASKLDDLPALLRRTCALACGVLVIGVAASGASAEPGPPVPSTSANPAAVIATARAIAANPSAQSVTPPPLPGSPGAPLVQTPATSTTTATATRSHALRKAARRARTRVRSGRTSTPTAHAASVSSGNPYIIYSGDSTNVINAKSCTQSTVGITWSWPSACGGGGSNEIWIVDELNDGYDTFNAYYNGHFECLNTAGFSGAGLYVFNCDNQILNNQPFDSTYQFRRPDNTPSCYSGWDYFVPSGNYGLTLNVAGGLGKGRNIIDYSQSGCPTNDVWYFQYF